MAIRRARAVAALTALGALVGCRREPPAPGSLRLVDLYDRKLVSETPAEAAAPGPRSEWRFDAPGARPFGAGPGVAELAVRDGVMVGRTTSDTPILHVERTSGLDNPDQLYAVEVRARVTAGANLGVATRGSPKLDLASEAAQVKSLPWTLTTPLLPGPARTYTIPVPFAQTGARIRHVLLRPSDAAGALFSIESVRLVFRKEHLAAVPSGVSWQGLKDIFQETLTTRAPEKVRFDLRLPSRPVLDLALGTPEDGPLTFRVEVTRGDGTAVALLEHTITTPHRWERRRVDLAGFAGARVTLSLSLGSERPGTIGFWGAPTIRQRLQPGSAGRPQGVILVQGDTLRFDHLDAYGYSRPTAPFLGRLAAEGALFRNALAQTAWTKASTTSVMTSLYPTTHGVHQIPDRIPASVTTLAESFRQAGYATLSLSSVSFTGRLTNLHQGFDELHESESHSARGGPLSSKTSREYVDRLAEWLEARPGVPFFVYLHVFDPHSPYEPLPPWDTLWADPARREEHSKHQETLKKFITSPFLAQRGMATREELLKAGIDPKSYIQHCKNWYDGSIRGMDAELQRLFERLRGLGVVDHTLFAFFADHGEEFHDHGRMWHGQSVYGEMIRVPLVLRGPGVGAGRVRDETVELIDVMPTLLEAARLPLPDGLQGRSLAPLLADGRGPWRARPAVAEKHPMGGSEHPGASVAYALVEAEWKLIHNLERPPGKPEFELFRFFDDPLDQADVAEQHPEVVTRLRKTLEAWRRAATEAKLKPDSEATAGMSADQLEKLRALGYIQ